MAAHPLEKNSLEELELRMQQACANLDHDIFIDVGSVRYSLIQETMKTYPGGGLIGNIHRALLTGQARSLRTVQLLTMRGYPQDAAAVTRIALERAYQQSFINKDQRRAEEWVNHANEKENFQTHFNCVNSTLRRWHMGTPEAELKDLVQKGMDLYKDISAYTHSNPVVTKGLDLRLFEGHHTWTPTPNFTVDGFIQCGRLMLATHRCAEIAILSTVFARASSKSEVDSWHDRVSELSRLRQTAQLRLATLEGNAEQRKFVDRELQQALHAN